MNRALFLKSLTLGPAALQIALKAKERPRGRCPWASMTFGGGKLVCGSTLIVNVQTNPPLTPEQRAFLLCCLIDKAERTKL